MAQDREILFAKALAAVTRKAKEQGGMISQEEVERAFEELSLSEEQFAMVFDYLNKNRIGIGEPLDNFDNVMRFLACRQPTCEEMQTVLPCL